MKNRRTEQKMFGMAVFCIYLVRFSHYGIINPIKNIYNKENYDTCPMSKEQKCLYRNGKKKL